MTEAQGNEVGPSVPYRTPEAFSQALQNRIATVASSDTLTAAEIRRQFAYSRFLYRVFASGDAGWVLKGATGLLARAPSRARHSLDIDLMRRGNLRVAVRLLQALAHQHADADFFTFDVQPQQEPEAGASNATLSAVAYLGEREFERFNIDLVIESNMTAEPEPVSPIKPVDIEGLPSAPYLVYPLVDHIADKHAAMLADYGGHPSSRFRDLVDLAIIAGSGIGQCGSTQPRATQRIRASPHSDAHPRRAAVRRVGFAATNRKRNPSPTCLNAPRKKRSNWWADCSIPSLPAARPGPGIRAKPAGRTNDGVNLDVNVNTKPLRPALLSRLIREAGG